MGGRMAASAQQIIELVPRLRELDQAIVAEIAQGDDPALPPSPAQVGRDVVELLWGRGLPGWRLVEVVPSSTRWLGTKIDLALVPGVVQHRLREHTDLTWDAVLELRPTDVLTWRNTGVGKAKALVAHVIERAIDERLGAAARHEAPTGPDPVELARRRDEAIEALALLGAWAASKRADTTLADAMAAALEDGAGIPPVVLEVLSATPADLFSESTHRLHFDPDAAADHLLDGFDDRQLAVLRRALALRPGDVMTLEQLGQEHGVTRERIRQVEVATMRKLEERVRLPSVRAFVERACELGEQVGRVVPVAALPPELHPDSDSLRDELYAWQAGPYRLEAGWLVHADVPRPLERWVASLIEPVVRDEIVDLDAVTDLLLAEGVRAEHHGALLAMSDGIRTFDDAITRWQGSVADKAAIVLRLAGTPMSPETLVDAIGEGHTVGSLLNAMKLSDEIVRTGKASYGLAAWGAETYDGLVPAMVKAIEDAGGVADLARLRADLAERFDVSPNSPFLLAHTSPRFIVDEGRVRLRGPDEPYVPTGSLELTARCYVIDGAWAWMTSVNHDVLRGSGFNIPESFAVHLGLQPGDKGSMATADRPIGVAWGNQSPYIGSLRRVVEQLDGSEGDLLFVRRATPTLLDFRLVRSADVTASDPVSELLLRVGATRVAGADVPAVSVALGAALGLGGAVTPQLGALRARLSERREHHLVELLDQHLSRADTEESQWTDR